MDASSTFTLQPGTLLRVPSAPGMRITVRTGRVWITETGCLDDHFVGVGTVHEITTRGMTLVEHEPLAGRLIDAVVCITESLGPGRQVERLIRLVVARATASRRGRVRGSIEPKRCANRV